MKTVRDACELHSTALSRQISDQVENLASLIEAEGDGEEFFERTHVTEGMRVLLRESIARLAGASQQAVFHLKQAMGGGKTHLLIGLGLLARHPSLRRTHFSGLPHFDGFDSAAIAAFNGRNNPDHFFWGEIAGQLGKGDEFAQFWRSGPKAPDEQQWIEMLKGEQPILILLDEMPPYFNYLVTSKVGEGTLADIATRAFANLLTAASRLKNVCVVISDLAAAYETGRSLINRALNDARAEIGRQERTITPVDLSANEIYNILRKQFFTRLPTDAEIADIASHYGTKLAEARKAETAGRGAEAIADEVAETYPFHPRLKNIIALFKENNDFQQTRGVIELVSLLLKSVWEKPANDVFLIGPQHFDLSITEVRDKLADISDMRDVIATDLWDENQSARVQIADLSSGRDTAAQVGMLLFTASLSTAVNAVKGLTREEVVECLASPLHEPSDFLSAFDKLDSSSGGAWYLHHTPEGRFYFDRQENLRRLLETIAHDAPDNQIEGLIRDRLGEMFKPTAKTAYQEVLPLPQLGHLADRVRQTRVLAIVSPDSKIPPDEVRRFFDGLDRKNNLCVLTGDQTAMGSVEDAARHLYAAKAADERMEEGDPQRQDLERTKTEYEHLFNATVFGLFDKVLFPFQRRGREPQLVDKPLEHTRDGKKEFNGEEQIVRTLSLDPLKLYEDIDAEFDAIRDKAEDLLWPENQDVTRWTDAEALYAEQPGMPWMPPKGIHELKVIACNRGLWEDLGDGRITKRPQKKKTSVQIVQDGDPDDEGCVQLRVNPVHAGPLPQIHYAEDDSVSESSPKLLENSLKTSALRVAILVIDPSGQHETGEPEVWENRLVIRNYLHEDDDGRQVELFVSPRGEIRYTLDGSEPRDGELYDAPITIANDEVLLRTFANAEGLETKEDFRFQPKGSSELQIDNIQPARIISRRNKHKLDSRASTFAGLQHAADKRVTFENVQLDIGQAPQSATFIIGNVEVDAPFLTGVLESVLREFPPDTPITMAFSKAGFSSGHDLREFCGKLGLELGQESIEQ